MDCFQYMNQNGIRFWGKRPVDEDAFDKGHGHDGSQYYGHSREDKTFKADRLRTPEQNRAIIAAREGRFLIFDKNATGIRFFPYKPRHVELLEKIEEFL